MRFFPLTVACSDEDDTGDGDDDDHDDDDNGDVVSRPTRSYLHC